MKKLITTMLAAVMISSCVVTPAFAYSSDIPSVGQQEYGDNGTTKINTFNSNARVYPTSQAPALKNTKTINGVTFSEYIKHSENDITLENGEKVHLVRVWIGMDGCMHSSASDARFIFHTKGITSPARRDTIDHTITTGERSNIQDGMQFRDLEFWLVKPFADKKGTGGEYVGNLTWQFLKDEDKWAIIEEDMLYSDTVSPYEDAFDVTAIVNGVKTNFAIVMTNSGTPKGDNTPVTTSTTPAVKPPAKKINAYLSGYKIFIGDNRIATSIYSIDNYSYIKLRDVASILNGTEKQFNVGWDNVNKAVSISTGQAYAGKASEFATNPYLKATLTNSPVYVDGVKADFTVYNIDGNNYFKLRDLAKYLNFNLDFAADEITIDTTKGYQ